MADGGKKASKAFGNAWRGAAAYHYYILAQKQFYVGKYLNLTFIVLIDLCSAFAFLFVNLHCWIYLFPALLSPSLPQRPLYLPFPPPSSPFPPLTHLSLTFLSLTFLPLFSPSRCPGCFNENIHQTVWIRWYPWPKRYLLSPLSHFP